MADGHYEDEIVVMWKPDPEREQARARARHAELVDAFKQVLETEAGKHVLQWVLDETGIFRAQFQDSARFHAFMEGRRYVGGQIFALAQEAGVARNLLTDEDKSNG